MRVIRCKNSVTAVLSSGRILQSSECTDEMFELIKKYQKEDNEFELINLFIPEKKEDGVSNARIMVFWKNISESKTSFITIEDNSAYWKSVSPLSMPMSFAEKVIEAEKNSDKNALEAYKNFWTLLSLNQDADVRKNLFRFLDKWGMVITKSGLFVGYRNVDMKEEASSLENSIFTDHYTHKMSIKIGSMVTLDKSKCDCDSSRECSNGLTCSPLRK